MASSVGVGVGVEERGEKSSSGTGDLLAVLSSDGSIPVMSDLNLR